MSASQLRQSARKTAKKATCQICNQVESNYTCSACYVPSTCSVVCFKIHKSSDGNSIPGQFCTGTKTASEASSSAQSLYQDIDNHDEPAYPDPLQRNDPKPLRTRHYEAIATSSAVRKALFTSSPIPGHPDLPNTALRNLLISIDKLSGVERERALQRALGVGDGRIDIGFGQAPHHQPEGSGVSEDVLALRALAEAIEGAVREKDGKDGRGR
ncbi:hypothetical protein BDP27DRAFT_1324130 [Rhodocollybia butyracea]|uniref:HIT-type domain-containing protein n=1 Tax=Rhodocollybia butyracea TaxID=206335 RepID=A0A9P5PQG7_9AGAR|nr:hypothetical protein BDP27DRAFT_1324130 [Rhodocollybia butyracea]